jgi:hypothetical protein
MDDAGVSAKVCIAGEDASATVRSQPQGCGTDLGAVGHDGGCCAPLSDLDRKTKTRACAGADCNVAPDPQVDKSAILYFRVRLGMFDQMIRTVSSRAAVVIYCREFVRDYTKPVSITRRRRGARRNSPRITRERPSPATTAGTPISPPPSAPPP